MKILKIMLTMMMFIAPISAQEDLRVEERAKETVMVEANSREEFRAMPEVLGERGTGFVLTGSAKLTYEDIGIQLIVKPKDIDKNLYPSEVETEEDVITGTYNIVRNEGIVGGQQNRTVEYFEIVNNSENDVEVEIEYEYELIEDETLTDVLKDTVKAPVTLYYALGGILIAIVAGIGLSVKKTSESAKKASVTKSKSKKKNKKKRK